MSIFYSPDEPKEVDIHSGRVTRYKHNQSFSRSKDITLTSKTRKIKIVPELHELKDIRSAFVKFVDLFTEFNMLNGHKIIGPNLLASFQRFKKAFDAFLLHCSQYFNSSTQTRRVGRYSPLIEFTTKLLKEWSTIIITINKLEATVPMPHMKLIQEDFSELTKNISQIATPIVNRTYYKDCVYASSNQLKNELTRVYKLIYTYITLSDVRRDEFSDDEVSEKDLDSVREEMVMLNRNINENFIGLIPSNLANTPEALRVRAILKADCGEIISLTEAGFVFRKDITNLLNIMKWLDNATRAMLDTLGIKFRLDVTPNGIDMSNEDSEEEEKHDRKVEVVVERPYFVEVPEPRPVRVTSHLKKKPYRGMDGLKKLPEDEKPRRKTDSPRREKKESISKSQIIKTEPIEKKKKKKSKLSKTTSSIPIDQFITSMSQTLGLELDKQQSEADKMKVIEQALKDKIKENPN